MTEIPSIREDREVWDFATSDTLGKHIVSKCDPPDDHLAELHVLYRVLADLEQYTTGSLSIDRKGKDVDGWECEPVRLARQVLAAVGRTHPELAARAAKAEGNMFLARLLVRPDWLTKGSRLSR